MINKTRFRMTSLVVSVLLLASAAPSRAADDFDTAVEPTSYGEVVGRVYDAVTGEPIRHAVVTAQEGGAFASKGQTTGESNERGAYRSHARIGRLTKKLKVGRLLMSSVLGALSGGATEKSKRVDVTRLVLRATAVGYKPFEGIVPCRSVSAEEFTAEMEPILLVPITQPEVSTAAPEWGVVEILGVTVAPDILYPKVDATVTVRVRAPAQDADRLRLRFKSRIIGEKEMKKPVAGPNGELVFTAVYSAMHKSKLRAEELVFYISDTPYDVKAYGYAARALIQLVRTPEEESAAKLRKEAYVLRHSGESPAALGKLKDLCQKPEALPEDFASTAFLSRNMHDYKSEAWAMSRVVQLSADDETQVRMRATASYADSLLRDNQPEQVISGILPAVDAIKEKEQPRKVPVDLIASIGQAYVSLNRLSDADAISLRLEKWEDAGVSENVAQFRLNLRLSRARDAVAKEPQSASALADYGRVLLDAGRLEESVETLQKAVAQGNAEKSVEWDLKYAAARLQGDVSTERQTLDEAIAAAESRLGPKKDTRDFQAWHQYALLLYRKALVTTDGRTTLDATALEPCRAALQKALRTGRTARETATEGVFSWYSGYMSPKVVATVGFAYPEANADFAVLSSLRTLEAAPDDYLSWANLARSFIDLQQYALAEHAAKRALELKADGPDAIYLHAAAIIGLGRGTEAIETLKGVVKANPRHPEANLTLSRLYDEAGDPALAAACIAAHSRFFGVPEP